MIIHNFKGGLLLTIICALLLRGHPFCFDGICCAPFLQIMGPPATSSNQLIPPPPKPPSDTFIEDVLKQMQSWPLLKLQVSRGILNA
jgi:hypothetical protein